MQQTLHADVSFEGARSNSLTDFQGGSAKHQGHASPQTSVHPVPWLISSAVSINYEKIKGRVQYFSPTTSLGRYYKEVLRPQSAVGEACQPSKRPYRVLSEISGEVESYLMELFWTRYNATKNVVDPEAYRSDKESGRSTSYSGFFHMCALAMGFLFADQEKEELRHISLGDRSSVFYRGVKDALDPELEDPEGLTTIRAMMVLSDLECAYGREELGWIYTGAAGRLALNFGLNLDCSQLGMSEVETQIRIDLFRSCSLHDMSWSLYLGRATCIKTSDVAISCSRDVVTSLPGTIRFPVKSTNGKPTSQDVALDSQIRVAMLGLTAIAVKIQATAHIRCNSENQYIEVAAMDHALDDWHSMLPSHLRWTPENAKRAPPIFFLLHQQYHTTQILLHGPCAQYEKNLSFESESSHIGRAPGIGIQDTNSFFQLSRTVSFNSALRVAEICSSHRERFGRYESSLFSVQHTGTAALLLIASMPQLENSKQMPALQHLQILHGALEDMSKIHRPVKPMFTAVDLVTRQYLDDMKIPQPQKEPTASNPAPSPGASMAFVAPPSGATIRYPFSFTDPLSTPHSNKKRRFTDNLDDLPTALTTPRYEQFPNLRRAHSYEDSRANDSQVQATNLTYDLGGAGLETYTASSIPDIGEDFLLETFFMDTDFDDINNTYDIAGISGQGDQPCYSDTFSDFVLG